MMKTTTRILALLLSASLLGTLVGCSGSEEDTPAVSSSSTATTVMSTSEAAGTGTTAQVTEGTAGSESKKTENKASSATKKTTATTKNSAEAKIPGLSGIKNDKNINFGGKEVVIGQWAAHQTGELTDEASQQAKILNKKIEETYNCKLTFKIFDNGHDPALKTSILAGKPACSIFAAQGVGNFYDFYSSGCLMAMEDIDTIEINDSTKFHVPEQTKFGGKHYGLTTNIFSWYAKAWSAILYVNFTLTAKAGYPAAKLYDMQNKGEWTWDAFEKVCKAVMDLPGDAIGLTDLSTETKETYGFDSSFFMYTGMLFSNDTDWIAKNDKSIKFNASSAAAREVLNKYAEWTNPNTGFIKFQNNSWKLFQEGKTAFLPTVYATAIINSGISGSNQTGAMYLPKGPRAKGYTSPQYEQTYLVIPKGVSNVRGVGAIYNALNAPLFTQEASNESNRQAAAGPATVKESVNTLVKIYEDPTTWRAPASLYGISANIGYTADSSKPGWYDYVYKVGLGEMTPETAIKEFTDRANSVLASVYGK